MGFSGTYTSSASQNIAMLNFLKSNGFKHTGRLKSMIGQAQEDGLFLGRADDVLVNNKDWDLLSKSTDKIIDFARSNIAGDTITNTSGDIYVQMDLTNVTNYQDFKNKLISDNGFSSAIKTIVNSSVMGKNSLKKNKFK